MTENDSLPLPVEARVYARLHESRDSHIEERRRARDYQAALRDVEAALTRAYLALFGFAVIAGLLTLNLLLKFAI